jgi:hypothetical protein
MFGIEPNCNFYQYRIPARYDYKLLIYGDLLNIHVGKTRKQ